MNKEELRRRILEAGEAVVTYRGEQSGKIKYNVVTLDFNNDYIKQRKTHAQETDNTIVAWAWDTDSFRQVRADLVASVVPLASILKNDVR